MKLLAGALHKEIITYKEGMRMQALVLGGTGGMGRESPGTSLSRSRLRKSF